MTIWLVSDTHWGHANMLTFVGQDGIKVRPEFTSLEEMDETMVTRWNEVVRDQDHVWHLGDVTMRQQSLHAIMPRLKGKLRLIRGNHDIFKTSVYLRYFEEIRSMSVMDGLIFTHIPIHPLSLGRFKANVHGHIHERDPFGPRYLNISVEKTGYRPISLEEVKSRVEARIIHEEVERGHE